MKMKRKSIILSTIFLSIASIGAPLILTSCGNTNNQSTVYDDSDEKEGKVRDIIINSETEGVLKYELSDNSLSTNTNGNKELTFFGSSEDESGQPIFKSVDEIKKDVAPSRNDWSGPTHDDEGNDVYKLENYSDLQGFNNFWSFSSDFYTNYSDPKGTKLDKNDLDANNILSNSLVKEVQIFKDTESLVDEEGHAPIALLISISLKPGFVWKSNGLNYSLSLVIYFTDSEITNIE